MDLFNVKDINETKKVVNEAFNTKLDCEYISIYNALDRIIYEDIIAEDNYPNFRRSTVDGYAIISKGTAGASESMPSMLIIKGESRMGENCNIDIKSSGDCVYVPTGGMLPNGADAVVMIEYTEKLDEETLLVNTSVAYGSNVVDIGDDMKRGEVIINKGKKIRPYEVGVLSSLGIGKVKVFSKPKIGIISTGDEVIECNKTPKPGEIRDINSYLLNSLVKQSGGSPLNYGIIKDSYEELKLCLKKALNECDMVLISGGSSVGKKDQTLKVIDDFEESDLLVHGISIKPGKPTIIAKVLGKAVFGLPGHPLSCAVVYKIIVQEYIKNMLSYKEKEYPISCVFDINYHKAKGREEYLPVSVKQDNEDNLIARPIFGKSGLISVFSEAYGYIKIDKNEEGLRENQKVKVYKF